MGEFNINDIEEVDDDSQNETDFYQEDSFWYYNKINQKWNQILSHRSTRI